MIAAGTGLSAGFLDLGLMMLRKRLTGDAFYRLGEHFWWIIPAAVAAMVLIPGAAMALIALVRRRPARVGAVVNLLAFVGALDACARLPVDPWASLLLSGGLALQAGRLAGSRPGSFLRFVRRTTPLLVVAVVAIMLLTFGRRAWSDHRARAALPPAPAGARNVLLIVWDTVRAGNLSLHGYGRPTSPNLERLAARGVRFDRAFSTAPWTLPSHASLFTGRWPHELSADWQVPLDRAFPTLAEYLAGHGYDTAGFVANLDYCSRETGLARGFAHYEDYPIEPLDILTRYTGIGSRIDLLTPGSVINRLLNERWGGVHDVTPGAKEHAKGAEAIERSFLAWLSGRGSRRRPFFAFLNFNDAHSPYEVPDPSAPAFGLRPASYVDRLTLRSWDTLDKATLSRGHVQMATDLYDEGIRHMDGRLGALLDELSRRGVLGETLVIVASDHGEHLGDHRLFAHGCSLYRQLVGVPLVIAGPGGVPAGRAVAEPVSLRDIPATVVGLLGLPGSSPFPGRSLARCWTADAPATEGAGPILMETSQPIGLMNQGREPVAKGPMKAIVAEGMHYIRTADGREELYFLANDPEEGSNLAAYPFASETLARLRARLSAMVGGR